MSTFAGTGYTKLPNRQDCSGQLKFPFQLVYSNKDNFFLVADYGNNVIRKVTMDGMRQNSNNGVNIIYTGNVSTFAGRGKKSTEDGIGTNASFQKPRGIAMNQLTGDVYVSELGHVIRKISPQGTNQ